MKKIIKAFIFILLLIPINVLAANSPTLKKNYNVNAGTIDLNSIGVYSNDMASFPVFEAYDDGLYFHIYSLDPESNLINTDLLNCSDKGIKTYNEELLNMLLSNVNQINKTNQESITKYAENKTNITELLNVVATQILVWEISSGQRTSFNSAVNNKSVYYKKLVSVNRNNTFSSGLPSLYEIYNNIVKRVYEKNSEKSNNTEENPYVLYYNVNNNRYQNIITSINYNTLQSNYEIKNNTPIKLNSNASGLLAYVDNSKFFTDVKSIDLSQKNGNTNTNLQNFYYFNNNLQSSYILASKSDKVPSKLYFKCAQGNFKVVTLEGSGHTETLLGSTYNIKDENGKILKFVNNLDTFTFDESGSLGTSDITYANTNSYTINALPDGVYDIIQVKVPVGNSFPENEADRTTKIKIDKGNFYVYNKVLQKYERNSIRIIKFTNYISKVYIIDNNNPNDSSYNLSSTTLGLLKLKRDKDKYLFVTDQENLESDLYLDKTKITIFGLDKGEYTITSNKQTKESRNFTIQNNSVLGDSILISFNNKKGEINFYNLDENGKYLNGGLFALRIIDDNSEEYVDVALSKNSDETYNIDENGEEYTFTVKNGKAVIKNAEPGKTYRIFELTPPDGYQVYDANNVYVDISIDSNGFAKSTPFIINKEIMMNSDATSNAELILSIRTGKEIVKYGIILIGGIFILTIFIFIKKKFLK